MFKRLGTFFLDISEVIVFAVGIFFFVYLLIMRPHKIDGESMMPNFQNAEYLLTEKVTYYLHKPQRGDVVVLKPPLKVSEGDEFIKRIIALPGEKVKVLGAHVYINDKLLKEPYIGSDVGTYGGPFLTEGVEFVVPDKTYFLMGDNREHSSDSRYWGPVPLNLSPNTEKEGINGRAWLIYYPFNKVGVTKNPNYN
ncbi:MAG TPA: signal peptidase I [Patescibacteria group bacterium]|nr:signal peptidase I [Patescibacteria group bacterium]